MTLGDWLNSVIINSAEQEGVEPESIALDDDDSYDHDALSGVHERLDDLTRRIDRLSRSGPAAYAPRRARTEPDRLAELIGRLDRRIDQLTGTGPRSAAPAASWAPPPPSLPSAGWSSNIDHAVAEIAARQRALDGDLPAIVRREPAPAAPPAQDLSGLEQQLRNITEQIETLRRPGVEEAINALRDELGEIARSLTEAMPRRAIDAIEKEIHGLTKRVAEGRQAGVDGSALAGIEQGLSEVRETLRQLTPAENLIGFNKAVTGLAHKIDLIVAQKDPDTLHQLESAITNLRDITSHVASNDAVSQLAGEVQMLAAKVDHIASSGAAGEALASLEHRIAALSDALEQRSQNGDSVPPRLESLVHSLAEKIEQIQLSRNDNLALGHLEDRIVKLVEKLDASDSRLSHLEAIERGLADLLVHIEEIRVNKGLRADDPAAPESVDMLKRDLSRTQDSLEAVHGTLGDVVDRLATIEQGFRAEPRAAPPPVAPPRQFAETPPPAAPAAAPRPALPPRKQMPIDPDLPPDHPLEPGSASAAARIAASEAALGSANPPVIPDPGGKSDFIAAARRAAHAAAQDPSPSRVPHRSEFELAAEADKPSLRARLSRKIKSVLIAASVIAIAVGSLQIAGDMWNFGGSEGPTASSSQSAAEGDAALARQAAGTPRTQTPRSQLATPNPTLAPVTTAPDAASPPVTGSLPVQSGLLPKGLYGVQPSDEVTGSVSRRMSPQAPLSYPSFPPSLAIPPASTTPAAGPEKLPIAIGGPALRTSAISGDAGAAYEVAVRYAEGRGVAQDLAESVRWFERAASKGIAPAQFRLASLYEKGHGVKKDLKEARRLYLAAAEKGNAKAMHNLAVLYAEGIDGKPDYNTAAIWFRKAADMGVSDSQYNLGILCARGLGTGKNLAESYKWFALAAEQGDREAARKLNDVAAHFDAKTLDMARSAAKTWVAIPQPETAIAVPVPPGGWDRATMSPPPAQPKPKSAGGFDIGRR